MGELGDHSLAVGDVIECGSRQEKCNTQNADREKQ
jgi:hypothetical protein